MIYSFSFNSKKYVKDKREYCKSANVRCCLSLRSDRGHDNSLICNRAIFFIPDSLQSGLDYRNNISTMRTEIIYVMSLISQHVKWIFTQNRVLRRRGPLMGGPQCRLSILRNGNVPCRYFLNVPVDF